MYSRRNPPPKNSPFIAKTFGGFDVRHYNQNTCPPEHTRLPTPSGQRLLKHSEPPVLGTKRETRNEIAMNKPLTVCLTLLIMMLVTVAAHAQAFFFDGGGGDDLWTTPTNWEIGQGGPDPDPTRYPGDGSDPTDVLVARTANGKRAQITNGMSLTLNLITAWSAIGSQTLADGFDMTGGTVELVGAIGGLELGSNTSNIPIDVNMSAGMFTGKNFVLGGRNNPSQDLVDSDAVWNLSGTAVADFAQGTGTIGFEDPRALPSMGTLNLSGDAMLTVDNLDISNRGNALVTIADNAKIILRGDHQQQMFDDILDGFITGTGVVATYDGNLDETVVQLDPNFVPPSDFTWDAESGDWNVPGNWDPFGTPGDANHIVTFGDSIGGSAETVFTKSAVTVNSVAFDNALGGTYAIMGPGSVTLESGSEPGLPATGISVSAGSHEFQAEVALLDDAVVDVATGATLEFVNDLILNGHTLTKTGEGMLIISNTLNTGGGSVIGLEGVISGSGAIGGDLVNSGGTLSPGDVLGGGGSEGVPEPSALVLVALGMSAPVYRRRRAARSYSAGAGR